MDYKKAYEEALEKARYIKENCDCVNAKDIGSLFEQVFPELKKSEDEKIRKGLIKGLSAMRDIHHHQTFSDDAINIDDAIAWLEKQGEQKTAWSEEDEYQINIILHGLDLKRELHKKEGNKVEEERYSTQYNWLKSLKDRIRPRPNKEQLEAFEHFVRSIGESGYASPYDEKTKNLQSLLYNLKKL